jgi:hypothetical protein
MLDDATPFVLLEQLQQSPFRAAVDEAESPKAGE